MRNQKSKAYRIFSLVIVFILAFLFTFPLYWIITGSFKTGKEINSTTPVWWPTTWTMKNYEKLMSKFKAPLFELTVPFSQYFSEGVPSPGRPYRQRYAGWSTLCGWRSPPCC